MKYRIHFATSLLLVITGLASFHLWSAEPKKEQNRLAFWKIEGKTNSTYLFGSIHLLNKSFYPLPARIEKAFKESNVLVLEADLDEAEHPATKSLVEKLGKYPDDTSLKNEISVETYKQLVAHLQKVGIPPMALNQLRPWVVTVALMSFELQKMGFNSEAGVDRYLFENAKKEGKEIVPLETFAFQLSFFTNFTKLEEDQMLKQTLDEITNIRKDFEDILEAWKTGDTKSMQKLMLESFKDYPQLNDKLLISRNKNWVKRLKKLHEEGKNTFVVVGAAHLVGPDSVIELLQKEKLNVKQL